MKNGLRVFMMVVVTAVSLEASAFAGELSSLPDVPTNVIPGGFSSGQIQGYKETLALLNNPGTQSSLLKEKTTGPELDRPSADGDEGRVYFVSTTGSDEGDGSRDFAWRSIQLAVSQLSAGDTLYILPGTYKESAQFLDSGTKTRPITVQGLGEVTIDGKDLAGQAIFETKGQSFIRIKHLQIKNASSALEIASGSHDIAINGLDAKKVLHAVRMNENAFNVTLGRITTEDDSDPVFIMQD